MYYSVIALDTTARPLVGHLNDILTVAEQRNKALGISGCLLLNNRWFVQALEGDVGDVWDVYQSILRDKRHREVTLVGVQPVPERKFGGWWMRCVRPNPETRDVARPHLIVDDFSPPNMSGDLLLSFMTDRNALDLGRSRMC